MNGYRHKTPNPNAEKFVWISKEVRVDLTVMPDRPTPNIQFTPLLPVRRWIDGIEIRDSKTARLICRLIPASCPFERTIKLFNRTLLHIPPLCKLNPFYEQFVNLRFRALCYLADNCGEDVSPYF